MKKFQVPVMGGFRKIIQQPTTVAVGTTIAEVGSGTITLTQLAAAINNILTGSGTTSDIPPNSVFITVGPGLGGGGGGGTIPIRLTAPIPALLAEDGQDGDPGPPGQAGVAGINGITGSAGPAGPALFMLADDGMDGDNGPPGLLGPAGAVGATGPQGAAGTGSSGGAGTLMMFIPDEPIQDDGLMALPLSARGYLTVNGPLVANGLLSVLSTAIIGTSGASGATITFPGSVPMILATASAAVLQIGATNSVQIGPITNPQAIVAQSGGNIVLANNTNAATVTLQVNGGNSSLSQGLKVEAGKTSADYNYLALNSTGGFQFFEIYGDGGVTIGPATTVDEGAGTLNVQKAYYLNGALIAGGGNANSNGISHGLLPDEPLQDDGFAQPFTQVPALINAQTLTVHAPNNTAAILAYGAPNNFGLQFFGVMTTGQSYGVQIVAGTTTTDTPFAIFNALETAALMHVDGMGNTVHGGYVSAQGATPAVTAAQTDIGITTTGTVITTVGGIGLPALAATFWVVNVNGVKYGIPCFAL
jgi:hypothetical protein